MKERFTSKLNTRLNLWVIIKRSRVKNKIMNIVEKI